VDVAKLSRDISQACFSVVVFVPGMDGIWPVPLEVEFGAVGAVCKQT